MVRAVCFDLDGTLFDDEQYVRAGLREAARALEAETGRDLHEEFVAAYFDDGVREGTFDHVLEAEGLSTEHVPMLVTAYHDSDEPLTPYPESRPVLERLATEHDLGLLTGGRNGRSKLERLSLAGYFDAVVVTADMGASKRTAEPFRRLLEELDADPEEAVYVGDRPPLDIVQPNRLGIYTVLVTTGFRTADPTSAAESPDATIDRLDELPDTVAALGD